MSENALELETITLSGTGQVPKYLHTSEFFLSLVEGEEEESQNVHKPSNENCKHDGITISFPSLCLKLQPTVENDSDVRHLLTTLRFWISSHVPNELVDYCLLPENHSILETQADEFGDQLPFMYAVKAITGAFIDDHLRIAAAHGETQILWHLHQKYGLPLTRWLPAAAAENGHIECLRFLHNIGCPWDARTCEAAAKGGQLLCLKYAHENRCPWDRSVSSMACLRGHLDCLRYCYEKRTPMNLTSLMCLSIGEGNIACSQYLIDLDRKRNTAERTGMGVESFVSPMKDRDRRDMCKFAACRGCLSSLVLLRDAGFPCSPHGCAMVGARNGHLNVVEYFCTFEKEQLNLGTLLKEAMKGKSSNHFAVVEYMQNEEAGFGSFAEGNPAELPAGRLPRRRRRFWTIIRSWLGYWR